MPPLSTQPGRVLDITSSQLKEYQSLHHERDYVLVDVRQPEEYQQGHIPGATLMPLGQLDSYSHELKGLATRTIIFYCRSGTRSARASLWAAGMLGLPQVVNLLGGFSGFNGFALNEAPRMRAFEPESQESVPAVLRRALELETGTYRFYSLLADQYARDPVVQAISSLAEAELQHARTVHRLLQRVAPGSIPELDSVQHTFSGDLIESGESLAEVIARAHGLGRLGAAQLLEFAAEVELSAYDLYKNLAAKARDADASASLLDLAQQEKEHADLVLRAVGQLAA